MNRPDRSNDGRHLHELDYVRGLGALAVVIYHLTYRGWTRDGFSDVAYPEVSSFAPYLTIALPGFFMVSGFIMFHTTGNRTSIEYAISRVSRLYPTYWLAVVVTTVAVLALSDGRFTVTPPQFAANLTMVSTYLGQPFVDGVYWSLVVELKFYFWVLVLLIGGLVRWLDRVLVAWLAISTPAAVGVAIPVIDPVINEVFETEFSAYFIIGAVAHLVRRTGWTAGRVAILSGACLMAAERLPERIPDGSPAVTVIVMLAMAAFVVGAATDRLTWLPKGGLVGWLAAISYPLYLLHERIGYLIINQLSAINRWVVLAVTSGLVLTLAWLAHVTVERPASPALRRLLGAWLLPTPPRIRSRTGAG